ncbi:uncharacterized protein LOC18423397 isoform X3 [Amborella trichopoda]|uniref:uncharacterized protein LOC18423397 isoform X3 n=1 Tax=Amborella trichopoda TaxID=13333 RepID=UPI0009BF3ED5|nr:uncharacterized protein LOC18423397 isoform X3 [Amborella trichopoda]|eukprot:XP_020528989.1 uncharacterized protein LOC18423397 isoform X3 [Amborella trichopoda]
MEALRKLEDIQRILSFMDAQGFSSGDPSSDRFLADFLLFMDIPDCFRWDVDLSKVQPCCDLSLEKKCKLISGKLPKVTSAFLEKALTSITGKDNEEQLMAVPTQEGLSEQMVSCHIFQEPNSVIGFDAMLRANSTLEDFCRSYFMFHGMDANRPELVFRYLPFLSFTESYIYQLDSFNEGILHPCFNRVPTAEQDFEFLHNSYKLEMQNSYQKVTSSFPNAINGDRFRPLSLLLEQHGLMSDRLQMEFSCGNEYWALERRLCTDLINKKNISINDVMRAIHLKSFDYRVLNLLLYRLRNEEISESHMEFLSVSEFLVEVSDDLFDYEDDVLANNFNILRMFVGIYGVSRAPSELAKYITETEDQFENLKKKLDLELASKYQKRCEEATSEGGKKSGHALGTWVIPPLPWRGLKKLLDRELKSGVREPQHSAVEGMSSVHGQM